MYIGKAQDIAIDQKSKNSIRGIIKNKGEKKQKQMVCVLCAERSHVCTDQNVMSVISGRNGMTVQNMTEGESGGKRRENVTFAATMYCRTKRSAQDITKFMHETSKTATTIRTR
jgi:hypothetical protein